MWRLFLCQTALLFAIAVLYFYFGLHQRFVFTLFWWDILLHVLGGLWVALAGAWFFRLFRISLTPSQLVALVLLVGGVWELFEYFFDIGGSVFMSYRADTYKDILDDVIGATLGTLLIRSI